MRKTAGLIWPPSPSAAVWFHRNFLLITFPLLPYRYYVTPSGRTWPLVHFPPVHCGAEELSMQIGVYGSGYLGTVISACLADFGTPVSCCHPDRTRMVEMAQGNIP